MSVCDRADDDLVEIALDYGLHRIGRGNWKVDTVKPLHQWNVYKINGGEYLECTFPWREYANALKNQKLDEPIMQALREKVFRYNCECPEFDFQRYREWYGLIDSYEK